MTLSEIVAEVKRNLGNPSSSTLEADIIRKINHVLRVELLVEGLRPYVANVETTTVADQDYIELATGFWRIHNERVFIRENTTSDYIRMTVFPDDWNKYVDTGKPLHYRIETEVSGSTVSLVMRLLQVPDDTYYIKYWYEYQETEYATDGSNDSDEPYLSQVYGNMPIIAGATYHMALMLNRQELAGIWRNRYKREEIPGLLRWQGQLEGSRAVIDQPHVYEGPSSPERDDYPSAY